MHTVVSLPQSTRAPRKISAAPTPSPQSQHPNPPAPLSIFIHFQVLKTSTVHQRFQILFLGRGLELVLHPKIPIGLTEGTSPDTPVDNASFRDFDVLVAAPVSGVEMMDALVDGMNGGEEIGLSSRSRFGIPNHHPLYQPPLPTPPPGVVLGGGKSRRQKKPPRLVHRSSFSDQDDDQDNGPPTATPKRRRPFSPGRSTSNATITLASPSSRSPQSSAPPTPIDTESSLYSARPRTAPSTPSSADKRKSLAPSISDIIRAHAPQEAQARARASPLSRAPSYSRSVGHTTCLGLRLITIDRWGLGRTEPRAKSAKGIIQWASVVEEVLDRLHIDECSVMAHSAGAPYALSFANKLPHRIRGEICLLAPWVGESAGYKWLKYVPNGILKTAQAAEWKLQTWMIGKPPTLAWEGIGYTQQAGKSSSTSSPGSSSVYSESYPRPSLASSSFSAYDDLRDFDGRFESMSTLGTAHPNITQCGNNRNESKMQVTRKSSRGILGRLKSTTPQLPNVNDQSPPSTGKRLKALRSMGSLKSKASHSSSKKQQSLPSPQLPLSLKVDIRWPAIVVILILIQTF
ncbi:alpha beta fold family [Lentinula edodes]|uniref:Alpha beta fold family n=1 Tax=Lentinula edodes TaxID=5353 RepID=A0A1Q3EQ55_LENED|nr:alpha beta fold family [Lentinula edodes]